MARASRRLGLRGALLAAVVCVCSSVQSAPTPADPPLTVLTEDVTRFYAVFDAAGGAPDAQRLQRDYFDPGTPGLHEFAEKRIGSAEKLAERIARKPQLFRDGKRCIAALPRIRDGVLASMRKLRAIYPRASFPPVTIAVGSGNSGGLTSPSGVIIGLETLCSADWLQADIGERFVHLIMHEYVHVQQPGAAIEAPGAGLLYQVFLEGGAEFIGEMSSGEVTNVHLRERTRGHECELEREFAANVNSMDYSRWLYNGVGDAQRPGDLGYWVGYRIVAAYYARAKDKSAALRELLQVTPSTAPELLKRSGWAPECGGESQTPAREAVSMRR